MWREPALGGVDLLAATFTAHRFAPHAHEEAVVAVVEAGAEAYACGRRETGIVPAGSVLLIRPGEVHHGRAAPGSPGWRYRAYYPAPAVIAAVWASCHAEAADAGGPPPNFYPRVIDDSSLAIELARAHRALESVDRLRSETALRQALGQLLDRLAGRDPDVFRFDVGGAGTERAPRGSVAAGLTRAKQRIDDAYGESLRLADLASIAGLSEGFLIRAFGAAYGCAPHAYLTQVRVAAARHRLMRGEAPAEVAVAVGFCDQSHLSRHFRRVFGVPPTRYVLGVKAALGVGDRPVSFVQDRRRPSAISRP